MPSKIIRSSLSLCFAHQRFLLRFSIPLSINISMCRLHKNSPIFIKISTRNYLNLNLHKDLDYVAHLCIFLLLFWLLLCHKVMVVVVFLFVPPPCPPPFLVLPGRQIVQFTDRCQKTRVLLVVVDVGKEIVLVILSKGNLLIYVPHE
jgi:hypothetical protein